MATATTTGKPHRTTRRKRAVDRSKGQPRTKMQVAMMNVVNARAALGKELFVDLNRADKPTRDAKEVMQLALDDTMQEYMLMRQVIEQSTPYQLGWDDSTRALHLLVRKLRQDATDLAGAMVRLNIDDRVAAAREAQIRTIVNVLDRAMTDAGITPTQRATVGKALKAFDDARALEGIS